MIHPAGDKAALQGPCCVITTPSVSRAILTAKLLGEEVPMPVLLAADDIHDQLKPFVSLPSRPAPRNCDPVHGHQRGVRCAMPGTPPRRGGVGGLGASRRTVRCGVCWPRGERGVTGKGREHPRRWLEQPGAALLFVFCRRGTKPHQMQPLAGHIGYSLYSGISLDEKDPTSVLMARGRVIVHWGCELRLYTRRVPRDGGWDTGSWWSSSLGREVIRW